MERNHVKKNFLEYVQKAKKKIVLDLFKIYIWRDSDYNEAWTQEIFELLYNIPKSGREMKLTKKVFYKTLFGEYSSTIDELFDIRVELAMKENALPFIDKEKVDIEDLTTFISKYCLWLVNELLKNGIVYFDMVDKKIKKLLSGCKSI